MVTHASSLGRNGIHDWLLIRASAILIMLYILYISFFFILMKKQLTYSVWRSFFACSFTKVFTLVTLISILVHCWIGMWQILTDYVKYLSIRLILHLIIIVILLSYIIYGAVILWSV